MWNRYRVALVCGALGLLAATAVALVPIPGPAAEEVCRVYLSQDRAGFRALVERLRFARLTLLERRREARSTVVAAPACVARQLRGRRELPRYCRITPPRSDAERELRELLFRRAYLESVLACLEEARDADGIPERGDS